MDDARLRALLHELYAEGASRVPPPPSRKVRRGLHLSPLLATGIGAVAAAVAVAIFVVVPNTTSDSPARLVPIEASPTTPAAQPSKAPSPSVSVEIPPSPPIVGAPSYLPAGARLAARTVVTPSGGFVLSYQLAGKTNAHQGIYGVLQIWRNPNKDGKAKLANSNPSPQNQYQNVIVSGHPAVLTSPTSGIGEYSVEWFAGRQLIAVTMVPKNTSRGTTGTSVSELLKVAASVPS